MLIFRSFIFVSCSPLHFWVNRLPIQFFFVRLHNCAYVLSILFRSIKCQHQRWRGNWTNGSVLRRRKDGDETQTKKKIGGFWHFIQVIRKAMHFVYAVVYLFCSLVGKASINKILIYDFLNK